jgi:hypothetical protein
MIMTSRDLPDSNDIVTLFGEGFYLHEVMDVLDLAKQDPRFETFMMMVRAMEGEELDAQMASKDVDGNPLSDNYIRDCRAAARMARAVRFIPMTLQQSVDENSQNEEI